MIVVWCRFRDSPVMEDFRVTAKIRTATASQARFLPFPRQRLGRSSGNGRQHGLPSDSTSAPEPEDGLSGERPVHCGACSA